MERIKQAIEKARARQSTEAAAAEVSAPAPAGRSAAVEQETDQITYSETRVVNMDPRHLEANRIIAQNKNDPRTSSFDLLRTQVVRAMKENGWKTLAIVSPTPACGKTVVAINLAISIAQQPEHTSLLVDFDLRRPKVAEYMGFPAGPSLAEFVRGDVAMNSVLVNPGLPRLVVMPNQGVVGNASELLAGSWTQGLVTELRNRYPSRFVVFDLPPLLATDDAIAFLPYVDCALLVVANGMNTTSEVEESMRMLKSTAVLGAVLNKADVTNRTYY